MISKIQQILKTNQKGFKDVAWSLGPQVAGFLSGFVSSILLARGLGASTLGEFTLLFSFYGLVAGISDLGVGQVAIRFASYHAAKGNEDLQYKVLRWAFRARMGLIVCFTALAAILVPIMFDHVWHVPHLKYLAWISLVTGVFSAFATIPYVYFQSVKNFKTNAFVAAGQSIINLLGICYLALLGSWTLASVIAVGMVSTLVGSVAFIIIMPKKALWEPKESFANIKSWFIAPKDVTPEDAQESTGTFALHLLIASIVVTLTLRADIWLMGIYLPADQMGLYNVATRFTLPLTMFLGAVNTALWPRASAIGAGSQLRDLFSKVWKLTLLASLFAAAYSLLAPLVAPYIFGKQYEGSVVIAQILCIRYCIAIFSAPIGIIGYSLGLVRFYWKINVIQLVSVVFINVFFVSKFGAIASAFALIINELMNLLIISTIVFSRINKKNEKDLGY